MSVFTCGLRSFLRKREDKMKPADKEKLHRKMMDLAQAWERGAAYKNVQDSGWNNPETFEWLWNKYTHKSLDPSQHPPNFKDFRKFEFGLRLYNKKIAKKDGLIWSKFHLPRAAMQNVPELKKFETQLIKETSFFRDFTTTSNKQVNEFLSEFKNLGLSLGSSVMDTPGLRTLSDAGQKRIRALQNSRQILEQKIANTTNVLEKQRLVAEMSGIQNDLKRFYEIGAGRAYKVINSVLQGADVESIQLDGVNLNSRQKNYLYKMKKNMVEIRKNGVVSLTRGLEKILQISKEKNLPWVDKTVERIKGMIKAIEFQHTVDTEGKTIAYKDMVGDKDFLALGFKPGERLVSDGKLAFSPHYMSKYTLGIMKTIKNLESAVDRHELSLDKKLELELNKWDETIVDIAKHRSPIIDKYYDADPYYFLKKYVNDIGIFNYKTHVKATFEDAVRTIQKEHLNPAKEAGRKDLEEASMDMLNLLDDVRTEIQVVDPLKENYMTDAIRLMTSVTYFRLMGGNLRSAARNATQRMYEFVEFGGRALWDAARWYRDSGTTEDNKGKALRQKKKRGLQWYDGKSKTSNAWDAVMGKDGTANISEQSRGALDDAYMLEKDLFVDKNGELQVKDGERATERVVRATTGLTKLTGKFHKIVEDWNRSKTFDTAFALAHQNLEASDRSWLARNMLGKATIEKIKGEKGKDYVITYDDVMNIHGAKHERVAAEWIENTAGEIAYNATLDLHFEYSKWAKAKAIRVRGDESKTVQFAKAGLGQFAHYRFNMFNLMYGWARDAGHSIKAKDFTSSEVGKAIRMGMLMPMIGMLSVVTRTDFEQLASNDIAETAEKMTAWLMSSKEKFEEGEISKETQEWVDEVTYGQGFGPRGWFPNFDMAAGIYEYLLHASMGSPEDPRHGWKHKVFNESIRKSVNRNENQELYEQLSWINAQAARTYAYSSNAWKSGGVKDFFWLELGFFPDKEQKEWSRWLYGTGKKGKKKAPATGRMSELERRKVLRSLSRIG
tara:strand:+ start:3098 stop:6121 length:3024 start_codon:yes stop_codon:yes gene_type:complete